MTQTKTDARRVIRKLNDQHETLVQAIYALAEHGHQKFCDIPAPAEMRARLSAVRSDLMSAEAAAVARGYGWRTNLGGFTWSVR